MPEQAAIVPERPAGGRAEAKPTEAEALSTFLAAHPSACPACGYALHRAADGRCPECGATLRVVLTAKRSPRESLNTRLWLIGLVGPCTAVGVLTLDVARVAIDRWVGLVRVGGQGAWMPWYRLLVLVGALLLLYAFIESRQVMGRQHSLVAMLLTQLAWTLAVALLAVNQYVFV